MKVIKRIVCVFLSVMILFFGVSNSYFSPVKMDQVEAAGTVVLGYETMQAICYYFGSLVLGYSSVAEVPDLTEEQIEKVGHAYIKSLFTVNGVPEHVADKLAIANQALFTLISNKQAYVFGSEALKEVAETEFQVIMGGNNGDEEPSPSPDEKKKLNIGKAIGCIGALSVFGATIFEESLKFYADKFSKGEETFIDKEYLAELLKENYFDSSIIDKMLSGETYELKVTGVYSFSKCSTCGQSGLMIRTFSPEAKGLHCLSFLFENESGVYYSHWYYDNGMKTDSTTYNHVTCHDAIKTTSNWTFYGKSVYSNIPVFRDSDTCKNFLNTGEGYENALNYLKQYRLADWLQDNWDGELFDPLTGLSYLNDLANMAKHQGLNAIGNNPSLDDMKQHLRDIIANLKPGYDPVTNPSIDPALEPICYPDTIPTPVIDPTADVVLQPKEDPTPTPSPDPQPSNKPQPTADPLPIPDSPAETIEDIADYVPTLADSFTDLGNGLKTKFPFSIPWDIHYILSGLATTPKAPRFELPLKVERYGIDETIVVDMARFQVLSDLSRSIFSLLFALALINLTIKVIGSLKEE